MTALVVTTCEAYISQDTRLYDEPMAKRKIVRKIVGATEVRKSFSAHLKAAAAGVHQIVLSRSEPVAVVVDAAWYHRACQAVGEPWEEWDPPASADA